MLEQFIFGLPAGSGISAFKSTDALYNKGGGNTGNFAFSFALSRLVPGKSTPWGTASTELARLGKVAVIPAANNLGPHINLGNLANTLDPLKDTKVVVAGLGAQSDLDGDIPELPNGTLKFLANLDRLRHPNIPNISVRGAFTKSVLDHYGYGHLAEVIGCPSLMINPSPKLGKLIERNIRKPRRIAVAAGSYTRKEYGHIERILLKLVTDTSGSYVGQHPQNMVHLTRGEADLLPRKALTDARDYMFPNMDLHEFAQWTRVHGNVFFDIPSWMEHYRHFDLVIGMRIHGIMVALQAGVPGICVVHDARTLELCQTMMVPYVDARELDESLSASNVLDLLQFNAEAFDTHRQSLARRYISFFTANGVKLAPYLDRIASAE